MKSKSNPIIYTSLLSDLYSAYQQIVRDNHKKGTFQTRLSICQQLSRSPAPRFYVSPSYAKKIINSLRCGSPCASRNRHQMHLDIYDRWQSLPPVDRTESHLSHILSQPAPSYYLSPHRINYLLYKATRL